MAWQRKKRIEENKRTALEKYQVPSEALEERLRDCLVYTTVGAGDLRHILTILQGMTLPVAVPATRTLNRYRREQLPVLVKGHYATLTQWFGSTRWACHHDAGTIQGTYKHTYIPPGLHQSVLPFSCLWLAQTCH
eukprot:TRINITY_DN8834_c0_g5_i1.p1 TRINITY_DN8834_c0_g5~~TRINITY_DN8834_c0_g5_i1.p1  ORF type:complete len:135 (-),score=14.84 TRINITY_DN8834_c0_g5_i1:8-412(-)